MNKTPVDARRVANPAPYLRFAMGKNKATKAKHNRAVVITQKRLYKLVIIFLPND